MNVSSINIFFTKLHEGEQKIHQLIERPSLTKRTHSFFSATQFWARSPETPSALASRLKTKQISDLINHIGKIFLDDLSAYGKVVAPNVIELVDSVIQLEKRALQILGKQVGEIDSVELNRIVNGLEEIRNEINQQLAVCAPAWMAIRDFVDEGRKGGRPNLFVSFFATLVYQGANELDRRVCLVTSMSRHELYLVDRILVSNPGQRDLQAEALLEKYALVLTSICGYYNSKNHLSQKDQEIKETVFELFHRTLNHLNHMASHRVPREEVEIIPTIRECVKYVKSKRREGDWKSFFRLVPAVFISGDIVYRPVSDLELKFKAAQIPQTTISTKVLGRVSLELLQVMYPHFDRNAVRRCQKAIREAKVGEIELQDWEELRRYLRDAALLEGCGGDVNIQALHRLKAHVIGKVHTPEELGQLLSVMVFTGIGSVSWIFSNIPVSMVLGVIGTKTFEAFYNYQINKNQLTNPPVWRAFPIEEALMLAYNNRYEAESQIVVRDLSPQMAFYGIDGMLVALCEALLSDYSESLRFREIESLCDELIELKQIEIEEYQKKLGRAFQLTMRLVESSLTNELIHQFTEIIVVHKRAEGADAVRIQDNVTVAEASVRHLISEMKKEVEIEENNPLLLVSLAPWESGGMALYIRNKLGYPCSNAGRIEAELLDNRSLKVLFMSNRDEALAWLEVFLNQCRDVFGMDVLAIERRVTPGALEELIRTCPDSLTDDEAYQLVVLGFILTIEHFQNKLFCLVSAKARDLSKILAASPFNQPRRYTSSKPLLKRCVKRVTGSSSRERALRLVLHSGIFVGIVPVAALGWNVVWLAGFHVGSLAGLYYGAVKAVNLMQRGNRSPKELGNLVVEGIVTDPVKISAVKRRLEQLPRALSSAVQTSRFAATRLAQESSTAVNRVMDLGDLQAIPSQVWRHNSLKEVREEFEGWFGQRLSKRRLVVLTTSVGLVAIPVVYTLGRVLYQHPLFTMATLFGGLAIGLGAKLAKEKRSIRQLRTEKQWGILFKQISGTTGAALSALIAYSTYLYLAPRATAVLTFFSLALIKAGRVVYRTVDAAVPLFKQQLAQLIESRTRPIQEAVTLANEAQLEILGNLQSAQSDLKEVIEVIGSSLEGPTGAGRRILEEFHSASDFAATDAKGVHEFEQEDNVYNRLRREVPLMAHWTNPRIQASIDRLGGEG